jgi:hypothetical protein
VKFLYSIHVQFFGMKRILSCEDVHIKLLFEINCATFGLAIYCDFKILYFKDCVILIKVVWICETIDRIIYSLGTLTYYATQFLFYFQCSGKVWKNIFLLNMFK